MHTDIFERRPAEHLSKFLAAAHRTLERLAKESEWEFLVVAGDPRLTATVEASLRPTLKAYTVKSELTFGAVSPSVIAAGVAEDLARVKARRDSTVLDQITNAAGAARGPQDTLAALQEGRVSQLVLSSAREWSGLRAADGRLLVAEPAAEDQPEPRLGERMIELALHSDAEVFVLNGTSTEALSSFDGVAAMLRW